MTYKPYRLANFNEVFSKEWFPVNVAYYYEAFWIIFTDGYTTISTNYEILSLFFEHYDIIVKLINTCKVDNLCYDYVEGNWTGAVGQVNMDDHTS